MADYQEFFMRCEQCQKVACWGFAKMGNGIHGECMNCGSEEDFDTWDEIIEKVEESD